MKDYSRKNYTDHQYRDWMRTPSSKSIFNQVLENTTGLGEFSNNKSNKTSLSRAVARFLKQSEFKKPYEANQGFIQMENDWEGPPGLSNKGFDQPWNMQTPTISAPVVTIFDAEHTGGWCVEYDTSIVVTGTHPIYLLTITWGTDVTLSNISGYGTNSVSCTLHVPDPYSGFVTIEASMISFEGIPGDSNVNVYEVDECCIFSGAYKKSTQTGRFTGTGFASHLATEALAAEEAWIEARVSGFWLDQADTHTDLECNAFMATGYNPLPDDDWNAGSSVERIYVRYLRFTSEVHKATFKFFAKNPDTYPSDSQPYIICTYTGAASPSHSDFVNFGLAVTEPFIVNADGTPSQEFFLDINDLGLSYMNSGGTAFIIMSLVDYLGDDATMTPNSGDEIIIFSGNSSESAFMRIIYNC
jgi:hypothetical protein